MEKIKNLPVFRMLAFAVALALILGICSVFLRVTASADDVTSDNIPSSITGTFGNYSSVKFTAANQIFDPSTVFTEFDNKSYFGVFVYEKDGKLVVYDDLSSYRSNGHMYLDFAHGLLSSPKNVLFYVLKTDRFKDSSSEQALYFNDYVMLSQVKSEFNYSDLEANLPLNVFPSRFITFDGFTDLYLIYTTATGILSESDCKSKIADMTADVNKMSISQWKETPVKPTGGSDNGRFTCFGNYNDYSYDAHLSDLISESIEYTKVVSYGDYARGKCYFQKDSNDKESFIFTRADSKQLVRYNSTDISFTFYNATNDLGACSIRLSASLPRFMERESDSPLDPIKFLTQHTLSYYHFNRIAVISSDSLKAIPAKSTVTATLDLTGFTSIAHSGYYLIELVNSISGDVVSSVMFDYENDGQSFKQNNDNIDVKYKYDNGNITLDVDLPPDDTGHINGIPDGWLDSSNNKYTFNYTNPDISDIFGTLDSSVNSISDFFQMCFSLLPLAISTIIIGGFALLVLLRVLGR